MFYEQALTEFADLGYKGAESITIGNIGICYWRMGDFENAINYYEKHYSSAELLNDKSGMQRALGNIGNVLWKQGKFSEALLKVIQQAEMAKQIGDKQHFAIALGNRANILRDMDDVENADKFYKKALKILGKIGAKPFVASNLTEQIKMYIEKGKRRKAKNLLVKLRDIGNELGDDEIMYEHRLMSIRLMCNNEALKELENMKNHINDTEKSAEINYQIFMLSKDETIRKEALNLFKSLIRESDKYMFRQRILALEAK